jgi:hypothetical protein
MESPDVRLARLEEAMVSVKGDTRHIREGIDRLRELHWTLSGKVLGIAGSTSVLVALVTTVVIRLVMKE